MFICEIFENILPNIITMHNGFKLYRQLILDCMPIAIVEAINFRDFLIIVVVWIIVVAHCLLVGIASTVGFEGGVRIASARTIDFENCLFIRIIETNDFGDFVIVGIVETIEIDRRRSSNWNCPVILIWRLSINWNFSDN